MQPLEKTKFRTVTLEQQMSSTRKNEKTFLRVFYVYKMKITFLKHFHIYKMNTCFSSVFQFYNMEKKFWNLFMLSENHAFETNLFSQKWKSRCWSDFHVVKMKKTCFWSDFHVYKIRNAFFETFFMFKKWNFFQKRDFFLRFKSLNINNKLPQREVVKSDSELVWQTGLSPGFANRNYSCLNMGSFKICENVSKRVWDRFWTENENLIFMSKVILEKYLKFEMIRLYF